jgi:LysM repeat protein
MNTVIFKKLTNTMRIKLSHASVRLSALLVFTTYFAQAQEKVYINYDAKCIDRLAYRFVENQANSAEYTTYKLNKSAAEKIFLEVGIEGANVVKSAPKTISCANGRLNVQTVDAINSGAIKAYLVKKLDSGFAIIPVGAAGYLATSEREMYSIGPDYDLKYAFSERIGGGDLATNGEASMSAIFYETEISACNAKAYRFKKTPRETCREDATVVVMPEVGLLQDISEKGQVFELVSINGQSVCEYLSSPSPLEALSEPVPEAIPESYSTVVAKPYVEEPLATYEAPPAPMPTQPECNISALAGEHLVLTGDNLFGIARRYGLTVANLRAWNGLESDYIYPCSVLKTNAPPKPAQPSREVSHTSDVPTNYAVVAVKKVPQPMAPAKIECNTDAQDGEHVVQQGQNLYKIAQLYSVPVESLRAWNKLGSDNLVACSKLVVVAPKPTIKALEIPKQYSVATVKKAPVKVNTAPKKEVKKEIKKAVVTKKSVKPAAKEARLYGTVKESSGLHVVRKGETIAKLAKKYNMNEGEFRALNNWGKTEKLEIGQVVRIKNFACGTDEVQSVSSTETVTSKGASVAIPQSYGTVAVRTQTATEVNNDDDLRTSSEPEVTSKGLATGTSVVKKSVKYHVVKSSETLYSIAKTHGISVEKLRKLNNMTADENIVAQQLLVLE